MKRIIAVVGILITLTVNCISSAELMGDLDLTVSKPQIVIDLPLSNSYVNDDQVDVSGTALVERGKIETIELKVNDGPWQTVNGITSWRLRIDVMQAKNTILARLVTDGGGVIESEPIQVERAWLPIATYPIEGAVWYTDNDNIYVAGGAATGGSAAAMSVWGTGKLPKATISANPPVDFTYPSATSVPIEPTQGRLYTQGCSAQWGFAIAGGEYVSSEQFVPNVYVYEFTTGAWRMLSTVLPSPRYHYAMICLDTEIIFYGGSTDFEFVNFSNPAITNEWVINLSNEGLAQVNRIPVESIIPSVTVVGDSAWFGGKYTANIDPEIPTVALPIVPLLDLASGLAIKAFPLCEVDRHICYFYFAAPPILVRGDLLFFIGGTVNKIDPFTQDYTETNVSFAIDTVSGSLIYLPPLPKTMISHYSWFDGESIYVAGGRGENVTVFGFRSFATNTDIFTYDLSNFLFELS